MIPMNTVIKTIEVIGTFAFALSGIIEARKKAWISSAFTP
jgi:uncharacterized membrane protein YeiH